MERLSIGPVVRNLRQRRGWSLERLAAESGVNVGTLSKLESGKIHLPTLPNLEKLANALGTTPATLLTGALQSPVAPPGILAQGTRAEEGEEFLAEIIREQPQRRSVHGKYPEDEERLRQAGDSLMEDVENLAAELTGILTDFLSTLQQMLGKMLIDDAVRQRQRVDIAFLLYDHIPATLAQLSLALERCHLRRAAEELMELNRSLPEGTTKRVCDQ